MPPTPTSLLHRRQLLGLAAAGLLQACAHPASSARSAPAPGAVVPFSASGGPGRLPDGWEPYVVRRDLPPTDYRLVTLDGEQVLQASGRGVSSGLLCPVQADPLRTPWLSWRWRVAEVPPGSSVADDDTDDAPARVVVAFDGDHAQLPERDRMFYELVELLTGKRLPFATLMYVWDAQLPVGSVARYARTGRIRYQVVESGTAGAGRWQSYRRNLLEDYQTVFGAPPGPVLSVGVLSDSDDLKTEVRAWYGDLRLDA